MTIRTLGILTLSAALCFSGCDFLRRTAGRPTSSEISSMRKALAAADSAALAAAADSVAAPDSIALAAADTVASAPDSVATAPDSVALAAVDSVAAAADSRYYTVIGAFSNATNADKLVARCLSAGLECTVIEKNTLLCVCVCPAATSVESYDKACLAATEYTFFPKDFWVIRAR